MASLSRRVVGEELYPNAPPAETIRNFQDMRVLNRWFGPHYVLRSFLRRNGYAGHPISVLDIGAGAGDVLEVVAAMCPGSRTVAIDLRPEHLKALPFRGVAGDATRLPFGPDSFDVVLMNALLHEFPDGQTADVLSQAWRAAKRSLLVIDLQRCWFAHRFLPLTRPIFGWQRLTMIDGPTSVAAGFKAPELRELARETGITGARVRTHYPWCRVSLEAHK